MAITNYGELQIALSSFLGDTLKASNYPDFIRLFEATANRTLAVREQQATATLTIVSGSASLPADYMTWRAARWTGTTPYISLEWMDPAYLDANWVALTSGYPRFFIIRGSTFTIRPAVNTHTVLFDYFSTIPLLTTLAPTNWLLTAHPDAYLFGSLCEAASFSEFGEQAVFWKARRDEVFKEIQDEYADQLGENAPELREDNWF
jgi:hypothetical protein